MLKEIILENSILIAVMLGLILSGILILILTPILNKRKIKIEKQTTNALTEKQIKKIDDTIDIEKLKEETFDLYKKSEVAKTKFDYDTLKEILTNNLYQEEEQKLKLLKENKQKLVATNIKLQDFKIISIKKEEKKEYINIYLHVSQYDYAINSKKKVIRGTDETEYQIEYHLTLEKNKNKIKLNKKNCTGKWIKNN